MANRYWVGTGGNWSDTANWSTTSGGAGGSSVPVGGVGGDDVFFDVNSGDCVVNATGRVCKTINFTGYINTITMTFGITVSGNVTLDSGMTISGAGNLTINATSTYDSNTKTFPNTLILSGSITVTLSENATVGGLTTSDNTPTLNTNNLYIEGNFTNNVGIFGTTVLNITSSNNQTWSGDIAIANNLTINKSGGTLTISGTVRYGHSSRTGTLNWNDGDITWGTNNLFLAATCNLTSNATRDWGNLRIGQQVILTLNNNATCNNFSIDSGGNNPTLNSNTLKVKGNFTIQTALVGTTSIELTGTGTWSDTNPFAAWIYNPLTINTIGTITLSGTVRYGGGAGAFTYTAGTIVPGTSTFTCRPGTYNINSSGFTLYNYSPTNGTHTINTGTITVNNNMRLDGNTTFAGTGGWTANDLTDSTAGRTLSLKDGSTYTVTGNLALTGTNASRWTIASSSATLRALLTLNQGASQSLVYVNGTRIDSSAGQTVWSLGGTLTDIVNWNNGTRPAAFNSIRMG